MSRNRKNDIKKFNEHLTENQKEVKKEMKKLGLVFAGNIVIFSLSFLFVLSKYGSNPFMIAKSSCLLFRIIDYPMIYSRDNNLASVS